MCNNINLIQLGRYYKKLKYLFSRKIRVAKLEIYLKYVEHIIHKCNQNSVKKNCLHTDYNTL